MANRDNLETIVNHLRQTEEDIRQDQAQQQRRVQRTNRMIQLLFGLIGSIALVNLYFVGDLAQEVQIIIRSMTKMYTQFGEMSERMSGMRHHVDSMSDNIAFMPIMVEQMEMMSHKMGSMEHDVSAMRQSVTEMGGNVATMRGDIGTMNALFRSVNSKMDLMRHRVGEMSRVVP
ncbi:hypothetical protein D5085_17195 [Ectothiorhodospiraceae bacterium BW-2]|nr:hypothetical protein D5085_17195 [Ectothiorhodospiraceae bacterium BW-2]